MTLPPGDRKPLLPDLIQQSISGYGKHVISDWDFKFLLNISFAPATLHVLKPQLALSQNSSVEGTCLQRLDKWFSCAA